jgi:RNA polymerase sigma factor (sigma-70 family)
MTRDMGTFVPDRPPTRSSFLERLKDWADHESWRQFLSDYGRVIRAASVKAGLRDEDADDVVQDTLLSVARSIPGFVYDRSKGSFASWVCHIAKMRVIDHMRRNRGTVRGTEGGRLDFPSAPALPGHGVDSSDSPFEAKWDDLWREHLLLAGMESVRRSTSPAHYQILHMSVIDGIEESEIAQTLGINRAQVYLVRHRLGRKLRSAIEAFKEADPPVP